MNSFKDRMSIFFPMRENQDLEPTLDSAFVRILTLLIFAMTLFGAFFAGLFPVRSSNDPWWHIKGGEVLWNYFMEYGFTFPRYDVFTYTGETTPWINHSWLSDLIYYGIYTLAGLQGAIIFKAILIMVTIWLLILYMYRNGVGWKLACFGAVLVLLASQYALYLRPAVFTYLFIVIFLHIILSFQLGEHFKKAAAAAVIGETIWINLHGGAVIGVILIGFWWLSELWFCIYTWLRDNPTAPSFQRFGISTIVLGMVSLASLVNPFGYQVHLLPFKVTGDWFLVRNIGELQSPNFHIHNELELIILALFLLPMLRAGSIWVYEGLAIIFFGSQALNYMRHIPLFALVAVPPIITALSEERRALLPIQAPRRAGKGFWATMNYWIKWGLAYHVDVIIALLVLAYVFGLRPGKIWDRNAHDFQTFYEEGYVKDAYPESAVNFILRHDIEGPIFNHDNFAGYLIYRLSPEIMKMYTDSRYDLWGSRYAKEELAVFGARKEPLGGYDVHGNWYPLDRIQNSDGSIRGIKYFPELQRWKESGKPYWQYVLDKYEVNFLISYEGYPIDKHLRSEFQGWFLIYDDRLMFNRGGYVVYLRNAPQNHQKIQELAKIHRAHIPKQNEDGEE